MPFIDAQVKTYRAEIQHPAQDLLLRMLVTISNSPKGFGTCVIPTLRLVNQGDPTLLEALRWNQAYLSQKFGDYSQSQLLDDLGLSKELSNPFHASILSSGPNGNEFEGILISHGALSQMVNSENKPVEDELRHFLGGLVACYSHLVCTPGFDKSAVEMAKLLWKG